MPPMRSSSPRGTGFIDFGRYLEANRPQAQAMAGRIADPVAQAGAAVEGDLQSLVAGQDAEIAKYGNLDSLTDEQLQQLAAGGATIPGLDGKKIQETALRGADVGRKANLLGSTGGIAASLQDTMPKSSTYGLGQNMLDAGLAGAAGGERFQGLKSQYGGLFGKVSDAAKKGQERGQEATKELQGNAGMYGSELNTRQAARGDAADRPRQEAEAAAMRRQREEAARKKRLEGVQGRAYDYSPIFGDRRPSGGYG